MQRLPRLSKLACYNVLNFLFILLILCITISSSIAQEGKGQKGKSWEERPYTNNELSTISAPFEVTSYFSASGWMGDYNNIQLDVSYREQLRPEDDNKICIKITFKPREPKWAGIFWQYPPGNWGNNPGRRINGATTITFWARGDQGDEIVEFKAGGIRDKQYKDSFEKSTGKIKLKNEWSRYEINLSGMDLSHVIGAFAWIASKADNPQGLVFYLDDIRYEK